MRQNATVTVDPSEPAYRDPVGPSAGLENSDIVRAAALAAASILEPQATETDATGLPRASLQRMADLSLMRVAVPPAFGGLAISVPEWREISEVLAGADCTAWFIWSQHHSLAQHLARAVASPAFPSVNDLQQEYLPRLASGEVLAGTAFSHVRKPGSPALTAARTSGGWELNGRLDWVTAWDVADEILVLAEDHGHLIAVMVSTTNTPGITVGPRQELLAMSGSHTRAVSFQGVTIEPHRAISAVDKNLWLQIDERLGVNPNPASFGLARASVTTLESIATSRGCEATAELAEHMCTVTQRVRDAAYHAMDNRSSPDVLLDLRTQGLNLAVRATSLALAAEGANAMRIGSATERRYREAAFLSVFKQSPQARVAMLRAALPE